MHRMMDFHYLCFLNILIGELAKPASYEIFKAIKSVHTLIFIRIFITFNYF